LNPLYIAVRLSRLTMIPAAPNSHGSPGSIGAADPTRKARDHAKASRTARPMAAYRNEKRWRIGNSLVS